MVDRMLQNEINAELKKKKEEEMKRMDFYLKFQHIPDQYKQYSEDPIDYSLDENEIFIMAIERFLNKCKRSAQLRVDKSLSGPSITMAEPGATEDQRIKLREEY